MPSRDDEARLRILEAYERAKARNPQLTQGEFMMRGAPGATIEKAPGKFKNRESAARYFRKIPRDMMLIYDTWADRNPSYKAANYYEGARWGFAVLPGVK